MRAARSLGRRLNTRLSRGDSRREPAADDNQHACHAILEKRGGLPTIQKEFAPTASEVFHVSPLRQPPVEQQGVDGRSISDSVGAPARVRNHDRSFWRKEWGREEICWDLWRSVLFGANLPGCPEEADDPGAPFSKSLLCGLAPAIRFRANAFTSSSTTGRTRLQDCKTQGIHFGADSFRR